MNRRQFVSSLAFPAIIPARGAAASQNLGDRASAPCGSGSGNSFRNLTKLTSMKYCDGKVATTASREGPEETETSPQLLAGVLGVPGSWNAGVPGAAKV